MLFIFTVHTLKTPFTFLVSMAATHKTITVDVKAFVPDAKSDVSLTFNSKGKIFGFAVYNQLLDAKVVTNDGDTIELKEVLEDQPYVLFDTVLSEYLKSETHPVTINKFTLQFRHVPHAFKAPNFEETKDSHFDLIDYSKCKDSLFEVHMRVYGAAVKSFSTIIPLNIKFQEFIDKIKNKYGCEKIDVYDNSIKKYEDGSDDAKNTDITDFVLILQSSGCSHLMFKFGYPMRYIRGEEELRELTNAELTDLYNSLEKPFQSISVGSFSQLPKEEKVQWFLKV